MAHRSKNILADTSNYPTNVGSNISIQLVILLSTVTLEIKTLIKVVSWKNELYDKN